jgi:hypothetical protein
MLKGAACLCVIHEVARQAVVDPVFTPPHGGGDGAIDVDDRSLEELGRLLPFQTPRRTVLIASMSVRTVSGDSQRRQKLPAVVGSGMSDALGRRDTPHRSAGIPDPVGSRRRRECCRRCSARDPTRGTADGS